MNGICSLQFTIPFRKINMPRIILPTYEIITEAIAADHLFNFLEGGVKYIVRESVIGSSFQGKNRNLPPPAPSFWPVSEWNNPPQHKRFQSDLTREVIHHYDDYVNDGESVRPPIDEYLKQVDRIELIVSSIEQSVDEMMRSIMATKLFDVLDGDFQWLGKDLIVDVRILPNRNPLRHGY